MAEIPKGPAAAGGPGTFEVAVAAALPNYRASVFMLNLLRQQIRRLPKGARGILLTCVYGLAGGLITVGFWPPC
jgi:hypothetical protein